MSEVLFNDDRCCFACGKDNPIGLKLSFERTEDGVRASVTLDSVYQGWSGIAHGGIVATLLDEANIYAVMTRMGPAVTAELNVRLRRYTPIGEPLELSAKLVSQRGRLVQAEGTLATRDGQVLAEGQGKFILVAKEGGGA